MTKNERTRNALVKANNIAIVRTDKIGDMIVTLPLYKALVDTYPSATIHLITTMYVKEILQNIPTIQAIHYADQQPLKSILKNNNIDAVIFPRMRFDEVRDAFTARTPIRIGSGYRWYSTLLTTPIYEHRKNSLFHEAELNVRMLTTIDKQSRATQYIPPKPTQNELHEIDEILKAHGIAKGEQFLTIHPGSGGSAREWNSANFGVVAKTMRETIHSKIVLTGTKSEEAKCADIASIEPSCINLCGQLTLRNMIALLTRTKLLIAHSTGVLHIAAAMNTPVLGLYPNSNSLSARRWGPLSANSRTISPPVTTTNIINDNMNTITTTKVEKHISEMLALL